MKKKLLILGLILSLSLTACNNSKNSTNTTENQPTVKQEQETEANTTETEAIKETENNSDDATKEEISVPTNVTTSIENKMNEEFKNIDVYAEIKDFNIDVENNSIKINAFVEDGTSEGTAEELAIKMEEKLDSIISKEDDLITNYNINIEIKEDTTNIILFSK
ncbi:hypothetical protein [Miniphocaeibacter halophilus]|uniref:Uncharacterized protein n=1 Tax=Miniphocaeibacter halophilus TaxID=2931922 RepID=A0AC61MQB7_9FIRM|nr:hypothetical protein [Miniphocaeibacter halophilus]QQK07857.1 hypothetical protein JFY71_11365 [Miniphocaeibacter halophilus]